jgi:hypothetical protein
LRGERDRAGAPGVVAFLVGGQDHGMAFAWIGSTTAFDDVVRMPAKASLPFASVSEISASGPARCTDHWRSVVVIVVGTVDPPHRAVISKFTGGQHIDNTGHGVGDIVVRARCTVYLFRYGEQRFKPDFLRL